MDVFGKALWDYENGKYSDDIITISSLDEQDTIPLTYLFRAYEEMPPIEQEALKLCKGSILDIGCGAGNHSLYLQNKNKTVTALDSSNGAIRTCIQRGIKSTKNCTILDFNGERFDTLLMLMNGVGIVGKLSLLKSYLSHFKSLLKPQGQIILDSSDIIYMFEEDEDGGHWVPNNVSYYGEVQFTMQYKGEKGSPFDWLYLDYNTLQNAANDSGFVCELVSQGEHYDYLARLTHK
ncbi:class I SAM-dependent methyltransferase [Maribacter sp. HTCC2170]|uniref:class I SAM-dependent methyltransferase n=1 Tax=Maribacter sp. (strain HTCC2170 / KCCM 42371) TaxID=313603 RepID=UPI00006BD42C|nr:class I SAM-dependent methyltransferase [Maribacter sp. HTCC2170]EAR02063.1 putative methyltransferase [Maribacter sp. HTCC2170]